MATLILNILQFRHTHISYIYVYIRVCVYIYTHTHTHTHTYIYKDISQRNLYFLKFRKEISTTSVKDVDDI